MDKIEKIHHNSLDEEYKDYVENDPVYSKLVNRIAGLSIARHFAEWQNEQMLKDAVEGEVHPDDCEIWVNLVGYGYKFNDGDKIRIVVLKEAVK